MTKKRLELRAVFEAALERDTPASRVSYLEERRWLGET